MYLPVNVSTCKFGTSQIIASVAMQNCCFAHRQSPQHLVVPHLALPLYCCGNFGRVRGDERAIRMNGKHYIVFGKRQFSTENNTVLKPFLAINFLEFLFKRIIVEILVIGHSP